MGSSNTKFKVGEAVVFTGSLDGFCKGKQYTIEKISTVDYFVDCVFFTGLKKGCYLEDLEINFEKLDELRNARLDKLIN